jgi:hypothetical protein
LLDLFFIFLLRDPGLLHQKASLFNTLVGIYQDDDKIQEFINRCESPLSEHLDIFCTYALNWEVDETFLQSYIPKLPENKQQRFGYEKKKAKAVSFFTPLLQNSITRSEISYFLLNNSTDILQTCLKNVVNELTLADKLSLLPYLPAEVIEMTIKHVPNQLESRLIYFTIEDQSFNRTFPDTLDLLKTWLSDTNLSGYANDVLNKISPDLLAGGASNAALRPKLLPLLRFMDEERIYSVIPCIPTDEFLMLLSECGQNYHLALQAATIEQKVRFLQEFAKDDVLFSKLFSFSLKQASTKLEEFHKMEPQELQEKLSLFALMLSNFHKQQQIDLIEKDLFVKDLPNEIDVKEFIKSAQSLLSFPRSQIEILMKDLKNLEAKIEKSAEIDTKYLCSITGEVMEDPVDDSHLIDGTTIHHTFDRKAIEQWLDTCEENKQNNPKALGPHCPINRQPIKKEDLVPNLALKKEIEEKGLLKRL